MLIICLGGWENPRQNVCTNVFVILNYLHGARLLLWLAIFPGQPRRASCRSFWSILMLFLDIQRSGQTVTETPSGCIDCAIISKVLPTLGRKRSDLGSSLLFMVRDLCKAVITCLTLEFLAPGLF